MYYHIKNPESTRLPIAYLLIALVYATVLASLPVDGFIDRDNYLNYADNSSLLLGANALAGLTALLFNEPLWLLMNAALSLIFSNEEVVRALIFFSAVFFSVGFGKILRAPILWFIFFIIAPQIMKNHIVHLRQGVAIAFFITAWSLRPGGMKLLLLICSALIHSSFFFLIGILFACQIATNLQSQKMRFSKSIVIAVVVLMMAVAAFTVPLLIGISGARQAEVYADVSSDGSGISFIFWSLIFMILITQNREWLLRNVFAIALILFYLCTYFILPFTARVFESGLAIVIVTIFSMKGSMRNLALVLMTTYFSLQWLPALSGKSIF